MVIFIYNQQAILGIDMIETTYRGRPAIFFAKASGSTKQSDRKAAKFCRVGKLAKAWPEVEKKLEGLLDSKYGREAFCCLLMAETGIRIGNEDSAEGYVAKVKGFEGEVVQTFGASTLKKEHIIVDGDKLCLDFVGKKVVKQFIVVTNPLLVEYGKKFLEESETDLWLNVEDANVAKFIKKRIDKRLTIKDFRTFAANCNAFHIYEDNISSSPVPARKGDLTKEIKEVVVKTSEILGNTPGICKNAYLSPYLIEWITSERGKVVAENEATRAAKKVEKEEAWRKMNEERVAQGLPRKNRKRKKKKVKKEEDTAQTADMQQ